MWSTRAPGGSSGDALGPHAFCSRSRRRPGWGSGGAVPAPPDRVSLGSLRALVCEESAVKRALRIKIAIARRMRRLARVRLRYKLALSLSLAALVPMVAVAAVAVGVVLGAL